jgi:YVTN family beta-propeller protein
MDRAPDEKKMHVSNDGGPSVDSVIAVVDTVTDIVTETFSITPDPYIIVVNTAGTKAYVTSTNFRFGGAELTVNGVISVIDTSTDSVTNTIQVGHVPNDFTMTSDGSKLYVVNNYDDSISIVDTTSETVTDTIPNVGNSNTSHPSSVVVIDDVTPTPSPTPLPYSTGIDLCKMVGGEHLLTNASPVLRRKEKRGFAGLQTIGNETREQVDEKVSDTAMAGVVNLTPLLESLPMTARCRNKAASVGSSDGVAIFLRGRTITWRPRSWRNSSPSAAETYPRSPKSLPNSRTTIEGTGRRSSTLPAVN